MYTKKELDLNNLKNIGKIPNQKGNPIVKRLK
jgi:hypothetical protein